MRRGSLPARLAQRMLPTTAMFRPWVADSGSSTTQGGRQRVAQQGTRRGSLPARLAQRMLPTTAMVRPGWPSAGRPAGDAAGLFASALGPAHAPDDSNGPPRLADSGSSSRGRGSALCLRPCPSACSRRQQWSAQAGRQRVVQQGTRRRSLPAPLPQRMLPTTAMVRPGGPTAGRPAGDAAVLFACALAPAHAPDDSNGPPRLADSGSSSRGRGGALCLRPCPSACSRRQPWSAQAGRQRVVQQGTRRRSLPAPLPQRMLPTTAMVRPGGPTAGRPAGDAAALFACALAPAHAPDDSNGPPRLADSGSSSRGRGGALCLRPCPSACSRRQQWSAQGGRQRVVQQGTRQCSLPAPLPQRMLPTTAMVRPGGPTAGRPAGDAAALFACALAPAHAPDDSNGPPRLADSGSSSRGRGGALCLRPCPSACSRRQPWSAQGGRQRVVQQGTRQCSLPAPLPQRMLPTTAMVRPGWPTAGRPAGDAVALFAGALAPAHAPDDSHGPPRVADSGSPSRGRDGALCQCAWPSACSRRQQWSAQGGRQRVVQQGTRQCSLPAPLPQRMLPTTAMVRPGWPTAGRPAGDAVALFAGALAPAHAPDDSHGPPRVADSGSPSRGRDGALCQCAWPSACSRRQQWSAQAGRQRVVQQRTRRRSLPALLAKRMLPTTDTLRPGWPTAGRPAMDAVVLFACALGPAHAPDDSHGPPRLADSGSSSRARGGVLWLCAWLAQHALDACHGSPRTADACQRYARAWHERHAGTWRSMFHRSASRARRQLLGEAGPVEVSVCLRSTCEQQTIRILCHLDSEVPIMPASKPRSKHVFGDMRCRRDVVEQPRQGRVVGLGGSFPQPLHPTPSMAAVNLSYVVSEHKDLQATAMALDSGGQYAVLAGRRYIALVNLDSPDITVKKSVRQSKFEVSTAEWNPHLADAFLLAVMRA
ncbi:uncharacterized protein [Dermacentor albipictus]|uniref:uncharacterized protein n=1 Tax=Dermacentor albipictus TaxID=60249 RepID=UPI0038FBEE0E